MVTSIANADYLGSWNIDDYITITATTHKFSTGAAFAATGAPTCWIYEDVTEGQIVAENMAVHDSITGLYIERVQLTSGANFHVGKHYTVLIQATVDSVAAITTHNFQILASTNAQTIVGGTPATLSQMGDKVQEDMDANSTQLAAIVDDTGTSGVVLGADSITAAKVADNAFSNEHFAADFLTATEIADNAFSNEHFNADFLTAAEIADDAFSAEHFNTDFLTADGLAASAITEIWEPNMVDLAAGAPDYDWSVFDAINWIYMSIRNRNSQTADELRIYKDNATTIQSESDISDNGTVYEKSEFRAAN